MDCGILAFPLFLLASDVQDLADMSYCAVATQCQAPHHSFCPALQTIILCIHGNTSLLIRYSYEQEQLISIQIMWHVSHENDSIIYQEFDNYYF